MNEPENIVIIGGGLLGCLTALFAARRRFADGMPMYHVTLLEKNPHLLSGAALMVSRDHSTGMEYPSSPETGKACTHSSIILNWVWDGVENIHNKEKSMQFDCDEDLDRYGPILLNERINYFREMIKVHHDTRALCGLPPSELFLSAFADAAQKEGSLSSKPPSIQTTERGFDIPRRMSLLLLALEKAKQKGNLEIKCGFDAKEIKKNEGGNGFSVEGYQRWFMKGAPTAAEFAEFKAIPAAQVFNASWEGLLKVRLPQGCKRPPLEAKHRSMALLDISEVPASVTSRFFIDPLPEGISGGMFSRLNSRCALAYIPKRAYENWESSRYNEKKAEAAYLAAIKQRFPTLAKAKVIGLLKQKALVEAGKSLNQRPYLPIAESIPGLSWGAALKGIYAERLAIEAVERFQTKSNSAPDLATVLKAVAKEPAYRMKEALGPGDSIAVGHSEQAEREIEFLKQRSLLFDEKILDGQMLNDESYGYYRTRYRNSEEQGVSRRAGGSRGR